MRAPETQPLPPPGPIDPEIRAQRAFLRRLARGILGDDAAAEDVVQEAETRALAHGVPGLRAWLVTVTRRLALNARRARERRARIERAAAYLATRPAPDPATTVEAIDLQRAVLEAVRRLDEPIRGTVWQRYYEDSTPMEIAAREGLPLATVKTRLRRGLERLRAALDERHRGDRDAWSSALVVLAGGRPWIAAASTTGGALMTKKLALGLFALVVAWLGWRIEREAAPPEQPRGPSEQVMVASGQPPLSDETVIRPARVAVEPSQETPGPGRTAEPPLDTASLELHVTWEQDGTDAARIGLTLWPKDDLLAELHALRTETDGKGRAHLGSIPPGRYALHSDRPAPSELSVLLAAGEERVLELALPPGLDVEGEVVDGAGSPVPGAWIWLEGHDVGSFAGRLVERSGADGSFQLRALASEQSLSAYASGFAPAFLERLAARVLAPGENAVRVTLVLDRPALELRGRVLDPEGRPVTGAHVALGTKGNNVVHDRWRPRARMLVTDEEGSFRADWIDAEPGVGPRLFPLYVLAEGYAIAEVSDEEVRAALGNTLVVRLQRGARIEGHLRDHEGDPLAGGCVCVSPVGPEWNGAAVPFALPQARSAADGSYALGHVPPGTSEILAGLEADEGQRASVVRTLLDDEVACIDLSLSPTRAIRGRVVDASGAGLPGRPILVRGERAATGIVSDERGEFVFVPPTEGEEWTLALPGAAGIVDQRERVKLGDEVTLVAHEPTGSIRGRFDDRAGLARPDQRIRARLTTDSGARMSHGVELDVHGDFRFECVPAGRYRVEIAAGEVVTCRGPWFELAEDQALELDALESREPSSIRVACTLLVGSRLEDLSAELCEPGCNRSTGLEAREGFLVAAGIEPGSYRLSIAGQGLALVQREIELLPGSTSRVRVDLEPGVERRFTFSGPAGVALSSLRVVLRGARGELVLELRNAFPGRHPGMSVGLAPGCYVLEVTSSEGPSARLPVEVSATGPDPSEIAVELR